MSQDYLQPRDQEASKVEGTKELATMPEKHLFVNYSHYEERPDPNMRHRIASHAARYGPNGSLTSSTSLDANGVPQPLSSSLSSRHNPRHSQNASETALQQSTSSSPATMDATLRRDYEDMIARFDGLCACVGSSNARHVQSKDNFAHSKGCYLLEDFIDLCEQQDLPFRVPAHLQSSTFGSLSTRSPDTLTTQCMLVAGQATVDGLNPQFSGKASKQSLTLQQKAIGAMQKVIASRPDTVDDSLLVAAAVLMSVATFYGDQEAYKAHKSSLQKLLDAQGGINQTATHKLIKALTSAAEVCLGLKRYAASYQPVVSASKSGSVSQPPAQAPLKLKFSMPPFAPEITKLIERLAPGFESLAKASKLSIQAIQLAVLISKWSTLIDQPANTATDQKQLLSGTTGAKQRLSELQNDAVETQRVAIYLLISLPPSAAQMKLERCLYLGILNLLHSVHLWRYPDSIANCLAADYTQSISSLAPTNRNEEDFMIWIALAVASEWRYYALKLKDCPLMARHGYDGTACSRKWSRRST